MTVQSARARASLILALTTASALAATLEAAPLLITAHICGGGGASGGGPIQVTGSTPVPAGGASVGGSLRLNGGFVAGTQVWRADAALLDAALSGSTLTVTGLTGVSTPSGGAEMTFTLSSPAEVEARILNIGGRPVKTLCRAKDLEAGANTLLWNAQSDTGLPVPNGTYLVELSARSADGAQARALTQIAIRR